MVEAPSLDTLEVRLAGALSNLIYLEMSLFIAVDKMTSEDPFQLDVFGAYFYSARMFVNATLKRVSLSFVSWRLYLVTTFLELRKKFFLSPSLISEAASDQQFQQASEKTLQAKWVKCFHQHTEHRRRQLKEGLS